MVTMVALCGLLLGVLAVAGWVVSVVDAAPDISQLQPRNPGQLSQVFAADGTPLGYIQSDVLRTLLTQSQEPQIVREATVAIEDRRFFHHGGVDYQGMLRAGVRDLFGGGSTLQGGSTLTMQLVDNLYLPEQIAAHHNLKYKIVQAKLAEQLEARHSKNWILTQYLNDVDYGTTNSRTALGIGAAAEMFFDEPVARINLAQAALLAGLPQAPSDYNPFLNPQVATQRRNQVLEAMRVAGYITEEQAAAAEASPLQVKRNTTFQTIQQPYVFDYVEQQLHEHFCPGQNPDLPCAAVDRAGLKVYTTINLKYQAEARQSIESHMGQPGDPAAALVSIDPTNGHILALASGSDYAENKFDYATQSERQTGSAFKPFVLMAMIHDYNGDPNSTYYDSKQLGPGWLPNYPTYTVQTAEHSYQGVINITKAMELSDNTVFAQLGVDVGMDKVDAMAHAMGVTAPLFGYPAEAIGGLKIGVSPLQMSDAYATMANGGWHITPTAISKVVFPDGTTINLGDPPRKRVFSDGEAYTADQVLKTVIQAGTGTAADYGCPAAGKTGTTSNYTDAWFVGYTPQLSTAVWVGYPNSTESMNDVNGLGPGYGGTLAAPIWHDFMQQASGGYCGDFPQPTDPFQGVPFYGHYAVTGGRYSNAPQGGTTTGNGYGGGNAYNNPTLFAQPPQPPPASTTTTANTTTGSTGGSGHARTGNGGGGGGGGKPGPGAGGGGGPTGGGGTSGGAAGGSGGGGAKPGAPPTPPGH
jgi:penicillin-binding protein 1A